ncbi:MAG: gamma subclass chorismate mutase AroQ, partial [Psychromonas sp.]|nr:gamma subclass chorismate mutase AroQ [Psychromonas sp.]
MKTTNKNQIRLSIITAWCLLSVCSTSFAASKQEKTEELFSLINQRLSYMEDVALYKAQHGIEIEDKQRETVVVNNATQAAVRSGIKAAGAKEFFIAQITAAKVIQHEVLKNRSNEFIQRADPRDLKKEIRPALINLGTEILRKASDYLIHFDHVIEADFTLFQQQINSPYLGDDQKRVLFNAMRGLSLSKILPSGFVDVNDIEPAIRYDLRYLGEHNFLGVVVDGYFAKRLILSKPAAEALSRVQSDLQAFGLGLLVYDAYRPQRAVDHFVRWAEDLGDLQNKQEFYPNVAKAELFKRDYIASRSSHTRGSTVDLTIIAKTEVFESAPVKPLDMGSAYDFFGTISWPEYPSITAQQRANRMLLRTLMIKHGFKIYPKEWWHFTLVDEPYPDTYFDFPIISRL